MPRSDEEHVHGRELLASTPNCQIERCGCGTLHLTVGPLTFRTHTDVAEDLWRTLGAALARVPGESGWTDRSRLV